MKMKKELIKFLVVGATGMMLSSSLYAGTITKINLNGNKLYMNPSPAVKEGATYLPIRSFEQFGFTVNWNGSTKTVELKDSKNTIIQEVGKTTATVNGKQEDLGAAVYSDSKTGSVMVPVRFIRLIGGVAEQDKATNTINVEYNINSDKKDSFGRPIKTSGTLPKKAKYYPYIAMGIPSDLYDQKFHYEFINTYQNGTLDPKYYTNPVNIGVNNEYYSDEKLALWVQRIEKHLDMILNFDYRTVSDSWRRDVTLTMVSDLYDYRAESYSNDAQNYVNAAKKNHLVIEGDYYIEPSTAYTFFGSSYVRVWVRFKITSKNNTEKLFNTPFQTFKTGVWYEGYADVAVNSNIDEYGMNYMPTKGSCIGDGLKLKEVK